MAKKGKIGGNCGSKKPRKTLEKRKNQVSPPYWHAIMHRREPDAWNSKYWWRKVGAHPVLAQLVTQAPALGYEYTKPQDFVDYCEQQRDTGSAAEDIARRVQLLEWELLFAYCWQKSVS